MAWPHGRLMSFLFVWQTLIQAPLSLASGAIGFSQYAPIFIRSEHTDKRQSPARS